MFLPHQKKQQHLDSSYIGFCFFDWLTFKKQIDHVLCFICNSFKLICNESFHGNNDRSVESFGSHRCSKLAKLSQTFGKY